MISSLSLWVNLICLLIWGLDCQTRLGGRGGEGGAKTKDVADGISEKEMMPGQ